MPCTAYSQFSHCRARATLPFFSTQMAMANPSRQEGPATIQAADARQRRARLREHLDLALAHIGDYAIVLIDDERRIAGWNRGAEQLLGYSVTEALGQAVDILFTSDE